MIVATHNGSFHADELVACVIFSLLDENLEIIRSRDPETLEKADYVIDVSGQYDLEKHFDHHPSDFPYARKNGIKFATAGLIWTKFGPALLKKLIKTEPAIQNSGMTDDVVEKTIKYIDLKIMQYVDITDNGQLDCYTKELCHKSDNTDNRTYNILNGFYMNVPAIPYLVALQNTPGGTDEQQYKNFIATIDALKVLFKNIFINTLINKRDENKVLESYKGGEILWLDEPLPWFDAVFNNWDVFTECKVAIYPNHKNTGYRIQSLPGSQTARFENRCSAPSEWMGKEHEELNQLAGITTGTFVHKTGFTGGADSKEDILKMAKNWIKYSSSNKNNE